MFGAAELEARILASRPGTTGAEELRRRPHETSDDFWQRLETWVAGGPADREYRRTCAGALYEVACWRERVVSGWPRVRPDEPSVLEREGAEFDRPVIMDEHYFDVLCHRLADWHGELDQFKSAPSRAEALWGAPDVNGCFLVRVVEFGDDASEDDYLAAGNMELGGLRQAAEEYIGHPIRQAETDRFYKVLGSTHSSPTVAQLDDGTLMATRQAHRRGDGWKRDLRRPTERELAAWAAQTPRPDGIARARGSAR